MLCIIRMSNQHVLGLGAEHESSIAPAHDNSSLKLSRRFLVVATIVIAVAGFFTAGYAFHLFGGQNCWTRPVGPSGSAVFTVVMANTGANFGFNGSRYHPQFAGPIMNVTQNQTVIIHVINNGSEAHGFQVVHYFDQGIGGTGGLAPGMCFDVRFTAAQLGSFAVRCDIFCSIHQFMLNGVLNVNP